MLIRLKNHLKNQRNSTCHRNAASDVGWHVSEQYQLASCCLCLLHYGTGGTADISQTQHRCFPSPLSVSRIRTSRPWSSGDTTVQCFMKRLSGTDPPSPPSRWSQKGVCWGSIKTFSVGSRARGWRIGGVWGRRGEEDKRQSAVRSRWGARRTSVAEGVGGRGGESCHRSMLMWQKCSIFICHQLHCQILHNSSSKFAILQPKGGAGLCQHC